MSEQVPHIPLIRPTIFEQHPTVTAAVTLRGQELPGNNTMSYRGATEEVGVQNRQVLFELLGFSSDQYARPTQTHSDIIQVVEGSYVSHEGDAVITKEPGHLLGVAVADCVPILLYDTKTRSYGAIHSGWRGTVQNIAGKTIAKMTQEFGTTPKDLYAWCGPAAAQESYEVGPDVAEQFAAKYSKPRGDGKFLLDNKTAVRDQLIAAGVPENQIEVDSGDTITDPRYHSARRDGEQAGRMLAVIGIGE